MYHYGAFLVLTTPEHAFLIWTIIWAYLKRVFFFVLNMTIKYSMNFIYVKYILS